MLFRSGGYGSAYSPFSHPYRPTYPRLPMFPIVSAPSSLAAPSGLTVVSATSTTVTLTWTPTLGALSYQVYQAPTPSGPTSVSALTAPTNSGATVTGLMPSTTYFLHVHAVDAAGRISPPSNTVAPRTAP